MKKVKVAIIDDEIEYLNDLARGLELFGYEVIKAASGTQAIDVINRGKPDIVLCDYKLDDMDGTQVIVKTKANNPGTKYIMVTAYYDEAFNEVFKKAGACDIIYKPIQIMEVAGLIHRRAEGEQA